MDGAPDGHDQLLVQIHAICGDSGRKRRGSEVVSTNTSKEHGETILPGLEGGVRELGGLLEHGDVGRDEGCHGGSDDDGDGDGDDVWGAESVDEGIDGAVECRKTSRKMPRKFPRVESYGWMRQSKNQVIQYSGSAGIKLMKWERM